MADVSDGCNCKALYTSGTMKTGSSFRLKAQAAPVEKRGFGADNWFAFNNKLAHPRPNRG